jgi:hypothetical protein
VAVDDVDRLVVADADMVGLDAHDGPQLLVHLVNHLVPFACPADRQQPEVGELRREWRGDLPQGPVCDEVRVEVEGDKAEEHHCRCPRRHDQIDDCHCVWCLSHELQWGEPGVGAAEETVCLGKRSGFKPESKMQRPRG